MTTVADTIVTYLNTNWAVGTGGTKPTLNSSEDIQVPLTDLSTIDRVIVNHRSVRRLWMPVTASRSTQRYTVNILCMTADKTHKEERLDTIVKEVVRLVHDITTWDYCKVVAEDRGRSPADRPVYVAELTLELRELAEAI